MDDRALAGLFILIAVIIIASWRNRGRSYGGAVGTGADGGVGAGDAGFGGGDCGSGDGGACGGGDGGGGH